MTSSETVKLWLLPLIWIFAAMGCSDTISHEPDPWAIEFQDQMNEPQTEDLRCVSERLPSEVPLSYSGSSLGAPNHFEYEELDLGSAGDVALLWTPPETGTYALFLNDGLSENEACLIMYSYPDEPNAQPIEKPLSLCPYNSSPAPLWDLNIWGQQGQSREAKLIGGAEVMLVFSCREWSQPNVEMDFSFTLEKVD